MDVGVSALEAAGDAELPKGKEGEQAHRCVVICTMQLRSFYAFVSLL